MEAATASGDLPFTHQPRYWACPARSAIFELRRNQPQLRWRYPVRQARPLLTAIDGNELSSQLKKILADAKVPKAIHDYKAALRELQPHGVTLAGVRDEPMLYSYLVNPTYPRHSLAEIALRNFNLNLSPTLARKPPTSPARIAAALRKEVEDAGLMQRVRRD